MPVEFCPRCRCGRNMRTTIFRNTRIGNDGKPQWVETRSFQCEACSSFVRSDEVDADSGAKKLYDKILKRADTVLEKPKKRKGR